MRKKVVEQTIVIEWQGRALPNKDVLTSSTVIFAPHRPALMTLYYLFLLIFTGMHLLLCTFYLPESN